MIRLFRKNRQESFSKDTLGNYLLYAVGEIILVVIGILIALYIDTQNEAHKHEQKVRTILAEVLIGLEEDIQKAGELIRYYEQKDSLIQQVFTDTLTYEDYTSRSGIIYLNIITNYNDFKIYNNGFNNLMRNSDIIPAKFEPFIDEIKQVYINDKEQIDSNMETMRAYVLGTVEMYAKSFPWFSEFFRGKMSEEAIAYHMNDPFYKNELLRYDIIAKGNLLPVLKDFRQYAIVAYRSIAREIQPKVALPDFLGEAPAQVDIEELRAYTGRYLYQEGVEALVMVEGKKVFAQIVGQPKFQVFARSSFEFSNDNLGVRIVFNRNEGETVESFTLFQRGQEIVFMKKE